MDDVRSKVQLVRGQSTAAPGVVPGLYAWVIQCIHVVQQRLGGMAK